MTRKFVESLGWKYSGLLNNREFYDFRGFTLVEHNGEWSIAKKGYWYGTDDVDEKMLTEFTDLIKTYYKIYDESEHHTLFEYQVAIEDITNFYRTHGAGGDNEVFFDIKF